MPKSFKGRYRFEDFIDELDAYMKANLGSYIDQMNLDRPDLTLTKPETAAFFFQTLTGSDVPYTVFVFYGETGTVTQPNGADERSTFELNVAIIIANSNEQGDAMGRRLLRYRDCLKALFNDGWNKVNKRVRLEVTGISPFPFSTLNQEQNTHVGIGVAITMEIV